MTPAPPVSPNATGAPHTLPFRSSIRRILCPTDLTPASDTAVAHACLIAETFDAELTLYHSLDLRRIARTLAHDAPMSEAIRRAELAAQRHLEARAAGTSALTRVTVDYGLSPHQAVAAAVAARRPDLTVMATHGRKGIAHLVMGSVAESAIEEGGRPILCVRGRHHGPALDYRRILVPTDLRSRGAFPIASTLAARFHAEVVALHLVPFGRASLSGLPQALHVPVPEDAEVVRFMQAEFEGIPVRARVELGPGWESIPTIAAEEDCDLVVLSTHRHDSLADSVLGSRAERIAAVSPCPVIVV